MFFSFLPFAVSSEKEGELVFSDEFSEDGAPNSEKWGFEHGFVRNMELQWYTPKNTYCKGGFLVIEARKEKVKNPQFGREPKDYWAYGREYAEYTSSSIVTKNSFDFKKGRIEVRAHTFREGRMAGNLASWRKYSRQVQFDSVAGLRRNRCNGVLQNRGRTQYFGELCVGGFQ